MWLYQVLSRWLFRSAPPPPPPPLLEKPWREINWRDREDALQHVNNYTPEPENQHIRILLYGQVGAGKSSFINSVQSVFHGRMCTLALADNITHESFTKKYTTYKIQKESPESFYPFVFNDIMGLQATNGVQVDDIKLALKGHVKDGYRFNPGSPLAEGDQFYNKCPTANDKVHVLVGVVDASKMSLMKKGDVDGSQMTDVTLQKLWNIREEASHLGIPQVAILTKIDEACPEIKKDLQNVYRSKSLKKKMEMFSVDVGIPMNCIFPVKNYHDEIDLNSEVDSLLLSALRNIVNFGEDGINFKSQSV